MAGAPEGNNNSSRSNRLWADTIKRALIQSDGNKIRQLAEALIAKAAEGDVAALKEIGDRVDGKSVSSLELSGKDGSSIPVGIKVELVGTDSKVS